MSAKYNALLFVAAVTVSGQLGWFITHPISVYGVAVLIVVGVLAWLLLHGNRVVWALAVLSGTAQLVGPLLWGRPVWFAAS